MWKEARTSRSWGAFLQYLKRLLEGERLTLISSHWIKKGGAQVFAKKKWEKVTPLHICNRPPLKGYMIGRRGLGHK